MKKIYKELQGIMVSGTYNDYRLIITPRIVELKLTPIKDNEEECNFVIANCKDSIDNLLWILAPMNLKIKYKPKK